jgi:hypothetical protein
VRAGISAIGTCRAPSSRQISSSLASRTSRTVCSFPALRMSASSRTEIASDPLRASVDIRGCSPDLHYGGTYVGLEAGQENIDATQDPSYRLEFVAPALHAFRGERDSPRPVRQTVIRIRDRLAAHAEGLAPRHPDSALVPICTNSALLSATGRPVSTLTGHCGSRPWRSQLGRLGVHGGFTSSAGWPSTRSCRSRLDSASCRQRSVLAPR